MATGVKKLTYDDYASLPADGFRHEVIEGEEIMTPAPNLDHQAAVGNVFHLLRNHVAGRGLGKAFVAPADVVLSAYDVVQPDVLFVTSQRSSILASRNVQGAPDLVVEVLSPSTAAEDRGPKLALYDRAGVREYWMVDLTTRTVEVREFGSPRRTRVYKEGQSFSSSILPDLSLRVDDLFSF
jgi:Uma2 family endonuclease